MPVRLIRRPKRASIGAATNEPIVTKTLPMTEMFAVPRRSILKSAIM